jgi:protein-S-isoprenylcysteine O-methyltransferase Ste14
MTWSRVARRIRVPLGFICAAVFIWLAQPTWLSIVLGGILTVPGVLLRAYASGYVKKNTELTMTGPYGHTRNPLYLGSIIIAAGFAVAARSWWLAGMLVALFAAIYVPVIRSEEAFLRGTFSAFDEYAGRVPRLLPRIRPARHDSAQSGAFSRALYLQHREYNAAVGTVALLLVLALKLLYWKH